MRSFILGFTLAAALSVSGWAFARQQRAPSDGLYSDACVYIVKDVSLDFG